MILVGDILVSSFVVESRFSCQLDECRGACCQEGDRGSPLRPAEVAEIVASLAGILAELPAERRRIIEADGFYIRDGDRAELRCLPDGRCMFAVLQKPGAPYTCLLEALHGAGTLAMHKPLFCHLFPLRMDHFYGRVCLNMEDRTECRSSFDVGPLAVEFCRAPLIRAFGEEWYDDMLGAVQVERRRLGLD